MLCDQIIQAYSKPNRQLSSLFRYDKKGIELFLIKLKSSKKFNLTDNVVTIALETLCKNPCAMASMADYIKPPFPITWVEYESNSSNKDSQLDSLSVKGIPNPPTKRVGFLIESVEDGFICSMAYSFKDNSLPPVISYLSYFYCNNEDVIKALNEWGEMQYREIYDEDSFDECLDENKELLEYRASAINHLTKAEKEAGRMLEKCYTFIACRYLINSLDAIGKHFGDKKRADIMLSANTDWVGEAGISPAIFIMLASKGIINQIPCDDLRVLNKARKLRGKQPLQEFSTLDITLTPEQQKIYSSAYSEQEKRQLRLHWVRGHFKRRKTGIYWWNPHMAGNKELGYLDHDYKVINE